MGVKSILKNTPGMVPAFQLFRAASLYFRFRPVSFLADSARVLGDYFRLKKSTANSNFTLKTEDLLPCLTDKTTTTPLDPVYFFQDSWGAGIIFQLKPVHHYDIGSSVKTMGIISQFVPTTMVDIRPIDLTLPNLFFMEGSILNLPFETNSIESISSLCVIEHIGLGRYGDPIDGFGSEKAIAELMRVCKSGGSILFSVPVDNANRIYFNAHRAFKRDYVLQLFDQCLLREEKYIYGKHMLDQYDAAKGYGIGLYHFIKK